MVEAKWCDVVMRIFALSRPKEDLAELAEAIAIGLGGSRRSSLWGGEGTKYQFNVPTLGFIARKTGVILNGFHVKLCCAVV